MNQDYIQVHEWKLIEEGFHPERVKSSESLFSLGNGAMGQRANFEERYTGPTFQGSYIGGVYYPDKTRVGWWKNGYPEYFAKVLNAPNWIGIDVAINGENLDLATCKEVRGFRRELDMEAGHYIRQFEVVTANEVHLHVKSVRFLSMEYDAIGAIAYSVTLLGPKSASVELTPYVDGGVMNEDRNWDEVFWEVGEIVSEASRAFLRARTLKTHFDTCTFMEASLFLNGKVVGDPPEILETGKRVGHRYVREVEVGDTVTLYKYGGYTVSRNFGPEQLIPAARAVLDRVSALGFEALLQVQKNAWRAIWERSDIQIKGDMKAQQAIRFNIFQLNQTYSGKDSGLNIGPKGFTGEKYGGSTYWDTEAYCLPFYMATKDREVARNLLKYRYDQLGKAIENAEKLGFSHGAALYPMVTMNGEECHNEWEITFEEIHRNGAIAFAIYNYTRYTGDTAYIPEMGLEVLIGIARFWRQRAQWSEHKGKYVILGVTGPNEYENNVNNNWYTNFLARWCLRYAVEQIERVRTHFPGDGVRIGEKVGLTDTELAEWIRVADHMYLPYSDTHGVYLQQDGFLDKELRPAALLDKTERPINQHWSWDRILRSPYIKQADTLQGFYFFGDSFDQAELARHFDFYEPFTVHESSLSPCVHAILAARLDRMEQAYAFYLRTSRLDLDDYNKEVAEGLHITSMAGTWMSIVEGFGGLRVDAEGRLHLEPRIPEQWESYSFKINFRHWILEVKVSQQGFRLMVDGPGDLELWVHGKPFTVVPGNFISI